MAKRSKPARTETGKGKSRPLVFQFDDLEVEVAFNQPEEGKSPSGSLKNAALDLTKARESSSRPPVVNNPG